MNFYSPSILFEPPKPTSPPAPHHLALNYLKCDLSEAAGIQVLTFKELPDLILQSQGQDGGAVPENVELPAGFTYLGQFLAHDISSGRLTDVNGTPALELKNLYGGGPDLMPFLYVHYPRDLRNGDSMPPPSLARKRKESYLYRGVKFRLRSQKQADITQYDVERTPQGIALMADCRDDQHFVLSQMHVAFLRFHNAVVDYLAHTQQAPIQKSKLFRESRQTVIHHYQWMIVHFYLKATLDNPELVDKLLASDQSFVFFNPELPPVLTREFSDAVFRMGHSQIAEAYRFHNDVERFVFRSDTKPDLRGFTNRFSGRDSKLLMEWSRFFDLGYPEASIQFSSGIDHLFVAPLRDVPFFPPNERNLPQLDLMRASAVPGHFYANCLKKIVPEYQPLTAAELKPLRIIGPLNWTDEELKRVPLSLYVLLEAKVRRKGKKLGLLGSYIIAEQLIWSLKKDPGSFLNQIAPFEPAPYLTAWRKFEPDYNLKRPVLKDSTIFGIQDILKFPDYVARIVEENRLQTDSNQVLNQNTQHRNMIQPVMMNLMPDETQTIDETTYNVVKSAFAGPNTREARLGDPRYTEVPYVSSSFSAQSMATILGLSSEFSNLMVKDEGVGLTFFFALQNNQLVLIGRLTNSTNIYIPDTDYAVSTGANTQIQNGDKAFITNRLALISTGVNNVSIEDHGQFSFDGQVLYDLLFEPGHLVNLSVLFDLVIGPCTTKVPAPKKDWLNLAVQAGSTYLLGEGCPDKCYYLLNQTTG